MEPFDQVFIAIDPVIVSVGALTLRWYGLMIALGIAAGIFVALREARRRGFDEDATYSCALWGVVGAVVGARLFHIVDRIDFYVQNPGLILAIQQGGLAIWGGVFGGLAAGALYCWRRRLSVPVMADIAAPALLVGLIIGRLGSIINGDSFGTVTDLPWALIYIHHDTLVPDLGEPTHPYPVYEIIWNTVILGYIWRERVLQRVAGSLFLTFLVAYSVGRFVLTFVRDEQVWILSLQEAHVIALVTLAIATPALLRLRQRERLAASRAAPSPTGA